MKYLALVVALGGCSQILGIGDLKGGSSDAQPGDGAPGDAAPDVVVSGHIKLTGRVLYTDGQVQQNVPNVALGFHRLPDDVIVGQATSDADGMYSLDIATGGVPTRGFLHVASAPLFDAHDSYTYFPYAFTRDTTSDATLVGSPALETLGNAAGTNYNRMATVAIFSTVKPDTTPLANAVVSTSLTGIAVRYFTPTGGIDPTLTATTSAGTAVAFNLPQADVVFSGLLNNQTFAQITVPIAQPSTLFVGLGQ